MSTRRGFLALLGLAPVAMLDSGKQTDITMLHPTGIPFADPPDPAGVIDRTVNVSNPPMRYLGFAQLKNEGAPADYDPEEISRFAKEAFGRAELYQWYDDGEDEA